MKPVPASQQQENVHSLVCLNKYSANFDHPHSQVENQCRALPPQMEWKNHPQCTNRKNFVTRHSWSGVLDSGGPGFSSDSTRAQRCTLSLSLAGIPGSTLFCIFQSEGDTGLRAVLCLLDWWGYRAQRCTLSPSLAGIPGSVLYFVSQSGGDAGLRGVLRLLVQREYLAQCCTMSSSWRGQRTEYPAPRMRTKKTTPQTSGYGRKGSLASLKQRVWEAFPAALAKSKDDPDCITIGTHINTDRTLVRLGCTAG